MQPPKASPQSRTYNLAQALESTCTMLLQPASSQAPTCKLSSFELNSIWLDMYVNAERRSIHRCTCMHVERNASAMSQEKAEASVPVLALRSTCILLQFTAAELYLLILLQKKP